MNSIIFEVLDRPIAYHRVLVKITKSVTAAVFLSQAIYWSKRCRKHEDGKNWFYKIQSEWEEETGLTRREQETCRRKLKALGILEEKKQANHNMVFYHVNFQAIEQALEVMAKNANGGKRQWQNAPMAESCIANGGMRQCIHTENTTKNTNKNNINAREDENSDFDTAQTEKPITKKPQHTRVGDIDLNFLDELLPTLIAKQAKKGKALLIAEHERERFQFTADAVRDYIAHRQKIKKPVTTRALKSCLEQVLIALPSLPQATADEALELAMRRGWQGIEADWLISQMGTTADYDTHQTYSTEGVLLHENCSRDTRKLTTHQRKIAALNNLYDISWADGLRQEWENNG